MFEIFYVYNDKFHEKVMKISEKKSIEGESLWKSFKRIKLSWIAVKAFLKLQLTRKEPFFVHISTLSLTFIQRII